MQQGLAVSASMPDSSHHMTLNQICDAYCQVTANLSDLPFVNDICQEAGTHPNAVALHPVTSVLLPVSHLSNCFDRHDVQADAGPVLSKAQQPHSQQLIFPLRPSHLGRQGLELQQKH